MTPAGTPGWTVPTRSAAAWYWLRVGCHVSRRALLDLFGKAVRRHRPSPALNDAPIVAEHRSALWRDGRDNEFLLVAGKVQNLRVAAPRFDAVVVPAGQIFSFWRQLGRPTRSRGFVEGREVRAGCVVPTVAGGLCQLSNALATCAAQAGMSFVERHGHTARPQETAAPTAGFVDATVFWNYVDLRLAADFDVRVEVQMSADELVVRLRAAKPARRSIALGAATPQPERVLPPIARSCLSCEEVACFRHRKHSDETRGSTAVLVDAWTPEFEKYLEPYRSSAQWFVPWVRRSRRAQGHWRPAAEAVVAHQASLARMAWVRWHAGEGASRQAALMRGRTWLARAFGQSLQAHHTHLIIDQGLLVPLWRMGALAGRTYDVLAGSLPASEVQRRLDEAAQRRPSATSLIDYRIDAAHCLDEWRALSGSRRIATAHRDVARVIESRHATQLLDWSTPVHAASAARRRVSETPTVVFPASALARKGAFEVAEAMRTLGARLIVLGTPSTDTSLWAGVQVDHLRYQDPWLALADVVVLPAHVEHSPRALLSALAAGLPVIATPACGLPEHTGLILVGAGDAAALTAALQAAIARRQSTP